ncbi:MAG: ankyrin repeat domain-containing protein [Verrucomicrobiota bacterium]
MKKERQVSKLLQAASRGDAKTIQGFDGDVNITDQYGFTPLMYAVAGGHFKAALSLIKKGADVNMSDPEDSTSLLIAVKKGHLKLCKLLLRKGATPDISDHDSIPAIDLAPNDEIKQLLITWKSTFPTQTSKYLSYSSRGDITLRKSVTKKIFCLLYR